MQKAKNISNVKPLVQVALFLYIVFFVYHCHQRVKVWENSKTIWTDVLEKFDDVSIAWNHRAVYYMKNKEYKKAIEDYNQALALNTQYTDAYNNKGASLHYLGEYKKAIKNFNQAIKYDSTYAKAYSNRGMAWGHLGELDKTIRDCDKAISIDPYLPDSYSNKGIAMAMKGNLEKAIEQHCKQGMK